MCVVWLYMIELRQDLSTEQRKFYSHQYSVGLESIVEQILSPYKYIFLIPAYIRTYIIDHIYAFLFIKLSK